MSISWVSAVEGCPLLKGVRLAGFHYSDFQVRLAGLLQVIKCSPLEAGQSLLYKQWQCSVCSSIAS